MRLEEHVTAFATTRPKLIASLKGLGVLITLVLVALPVVMPDTFSMLHHVEVDTDPENMLEQHEPARVFHNETKKTMDLNDIVVVGVVNDEHPQGVFNVDSLARIYELTQYALTLHGEAIGEEDPRAGVISVDVIAPSTVDNIEPGGPGVVKFEWLMPEPPKTEEEALAVREKAARIPFLNGTLVSEDGKALAVYLPITSKDLSYQIYTRLQDKVDSLGGNDVFHITGLPVAEDTFGVEMFIQMAISAPLAMLVIFLLLLFFFRKLIVIVSPMIVAMVSVIGTMGLLIITGNTIHIMSSMIPIFIMPIAVLDSVHILSEFFDRYQATRDRKATIHTVMHELFRPMLFTSLTSAAGFASLALTPIPPVQVFGVFVACGIMLAWLLTIIFIPAYIMFIPEKKLENFGSTHHGDDDEEENRHTLMGRLLLRSGRATYGGSKLILAVALALVLVSGYGITQIQINDNPTKWFKQSHPIRVADTVLNQHFGGTYMAYLSLRPAEKEVPYDMQYAQIFERMDAFAKDGESGTPGLAAAAAETRAHFDTNPVSPLSQESLLAALESFFEERYDAASGDSAYPWDELLLFLDSERDRGQTFKQPEALRYIAQLQDYLQTVNAVGKSNSLADIVKTVHRELFEGEEEAFRIPDTSRAVAQCLITFESGHRPQDLTHFVTPSFDQSVLWLQLQSGDNKDMSEVVAAVEDYFKENPPPMPLRHDWFGLTYINVIWQEKMVSGMLQAFMGSFLVVFLMMTLLFRSALWGILSMIPLTLTVGLIYGVIGLVGKDYDMPVAVLSSLSLGLAVDFAIHFLSRTRTLYERYGTWKDTFPHMFGEPARAIARNVLVIAIGFLPLLAAPLLPYVTVGFFLAAILFVSGAGTLLLLSALIRQAEPLLFPRTQALGLLCRRGTLIIAGASFVALMTINLHQFLAMHWTSLAIAGVVVMAVWIPVCWLMSRRHACKQFSTPIPQD